MNFYESGFDKNIESSFSFEHLTKEQVKKMCDAAKEAQDKKDPRVIALAAIRLFKAEGLDRIRRKTLYSRTKSERVSVDRMMHTVFKQLEENIGNIEIEQFIDKNSEERQEICGKTDTLIDKLRLNERIFPFSDELLRFTKHLLSHYDHSFKVQLDEATSILSEIHRDLEKEMVTEVQTAKETRKILKNIEKILMMDKQHEQLIKAKDFIKRAIYRNLREFLSEKERDPSPKGTQVDNEIVESQARRIAELNQENIAIQNLNKELNIEKENLNSANSGLVKKLDEVEAKLTDLQEKLEELKKKPPTSKNKKDSGSMLIQDAYKKLQTEYQELLFKIDEEVSQKVEEKLDEEVGKAVEEKVDEAEKEWREERENLELRVLELEEQVENIPTQSVDTDAIEKLENNINRLQEEITKLKKQLTEKDKKIVEITSQREEKDSILSDFLNTSNGFHRDLLTFQEKISTSTEN